MRESVIRHQHLLDHATVLHRPRERLLIEEGSDLRPGARIGQPEHFDGPRALERRGGPQEPRRPGPDQRKPNAERVPRVIRVQEKSEKRLLARLPWSCHERQERNSRPWTVTA